MNDKKACPTQGGTTIAWVVEIKNEYDVWEKLKTIDVPEPLSPLGIPTGGMIPGIFKMFNFFSHESAMALAWQYIAKNGCLPLNCVRVVPYTVEYDIKAYRNEEDSIDVGWV